MITLDVSEHRTQSIFNNADDEMLKNTIWVIDTCSLENIYVNHWGKLRTVIHSHTIRIPVVVHSEMKKWLESLLDLERKYEEQKRELSAEQKKAKNICMKINQFLNTLWNNKESRRKLFIDVRNHSHFRFVHDHICMFRDVVSKALVRDFLEEYTRTITDWKNHEKERKWVQAVLTGVIPEPGIQGWTKDNIKKRWVNSAKGRPHLMDIYKKIESIDQYWQYVWKVQADKIEHYAKSIYYCNSDKDVYRTVQHVCEESRKDIKNDAEIVTSFILEGKNGKLITRDADVQELFFLYEMWQSPV